MIRTKSTYYIPSHISGILLQFVQNNQGRITNDAGHWMFSSELTLDELNMKFPQTTFMHMQNVPLPKTVFVVNEDDFLQHFDVEQFMKHHKVYEGYKEVIIDATFHPDATIAKYFRVVPDEFNRFFYKVGRERVVENAKMNLLISLMQDNDSVDSVNSEYE